jgi:hypothetical protein
MMHPLYQQARETKMDTTKPKEEAVTEEVIDVIKEKELTPELKDELYKIMNDNYSKGAFCGMVTNLYFNHVQSENPIGFDTIIEQALMIRLQAKKMAGFTQESKPKSVDEDLCIEPEKPTIKLVM